MRVLILIGLAACAGEKVASGTVIEASGEVSCNGEPIGPGDEVFSGDTIKIEKGRLEIDVLGVGRVRVFSDTKLELGGKAHERSIALATGMVWAFVTKLSGDSFEIEGQHAVAGVRGTEFIVESTDDGDDVRVVKGDVDVAAKHEREKRHRVKGGERMHTKRRESPSSAEHYDHASDHARWENLRSAGREIKEGFKKGGRAVRDGGRKFGRRVRDFFR
jgi:hypothetical protein